jgi:hypothetical protein
MQEAVSNKVPQVQVVAQHNGQVARYLPGRDKDRNQLENQAVDRGNIQVERQARGSTSRQIVHKQCRASYKTRSNAETVLRQVQHNSSCNSNRQLLHKGKVRLANNLNFRIKCSLTSRSSSNINCLPNWLIGWAG